MFSERLMEGKVAIVTGSAQGLGYGIARRLAEAGAAVVIADLSERGEESAAGLRQAGLQAMYVRTDVSNEQQTVHMISETVSVYGGVDIVVNNAGYYPRSTVQETSLAMWDKVMELNLKGAFLSSKAAIPELIRRGGGSIINIGSSHATSGLPELFAYSVSKGGLLTMTRNMAGSLSQHKIRVNCINPGWVATDGELEARAANGQSLEWLQARGAMLPLGRMQTIDDTAAMLLFLCSDLATQITGQFMQIDGGKEVASLFDDRSLAGD